MIEVYKKYNFKYNEQIFMKNFKNAITDKGYNTLALFHELLLSIGIPSYETARSYYNKRRIIPSDVLTKLSTILNLNINEMMLPDSIPVNIYNKHISLDKLFDIINTIFYEFNNSRHPEVQTNINERINELEEYINLLSMILSRYNYFLQKYYFADLSNEELLELGMFCNFFIVERETLRPINLHEFKILIKNSGTEDFIKEFYNKCTLALNDIPLIEYLNEMIDFIPDYLIDLIINLLPEIDRKQVKEKVR